MDKLVNSYRLELTTNNALNLLVFNYSREDLDYLRQNRAFDYAWVHYWKKRLQELLKDQHPDTDLDE